MNEKRKVKVTVGVYYIEARTSWAKAALIIKDQTGDTAPREVVLEIDRPGDIAYIRERLNHIETAWHKELESIQGK